MAPPTHPCTIADATWTCVTPPLCLQGFGVTAVLRQAWSAVGSLTERLADVAYDYVPDSVSRPTVRSGPCAALDVRIMHPCYAVLHDTGIRKTLGATVTSETYIILQCLACQEVPRPRSVDCRPSGRLSRENRRPTRMSNGRVGKFMPCPCNTDAIQGEKVTCTVVFLPSRISTRDARIWS